MIPLFSPLVALIAGIFISPHLDSYYVWLCLPLACLLGIAHGRLLLVAIFLFGAGLRSLEPAVPADPGSDAVRMTGRLLRRPEWRGLGVYLDVEVAGIDGRPYQGRARLSEFLDQPELKRLFDELRLGSGDRVEIVVRLQRPMTYRNPGVFDFRRRLERDGIYWTGVIRNPRLITVVDRGWHGWDRLQTWIEGRLHRHFESDSSVRGLVLGMVLGQKHGLTAETERQFQAGGLYHLVVVSGFNLAVVATAGAWLARLIVRKRGARLVLAAACVVMYALIVGGQTPVIRAALMAFILIAGKAMDRGYSPLNSIALTAFIILITSPTALEDPSFQMTFAAVLGLTALGVPAARWLFNPLETRLRDFSNSSIDGRLPPPAADWRVSRRMWCELHGLPSIVVVLPWRVFQFAGEALVAAAAMELTLAYFMVESFHRISPISPLLNVPAGLIAAIITPLGLLLIVLPDAAAAPAAWVIHQLVEALHWMLTVTLSLPHASMRTPSAPPALWGIYIGMMLILLIGVSRKNLHACMIGLPVLIGLQWTVIMVDFSPAPPRDVVLTFLDVGQGDSTLIEFPDGRRILVDGGGVSAGRFLGLRDESTFSIGEDVVSSYLFSRRIRRLDAVVLTHAHHDHMDGLHDILENFQIGEIWFGRNPVIPAYRAILERTQERQIPIRWIWAGVTIGEFTVLHPPRTWRVRRTAQNNDSVVLLLRSGDHTALLPGDIEMAIPAPEHVTVLKTPHHGSGGTRLRVRSSLPIISVGGNNPFGHPHPAKLPALRTDRLGAIEVTLAGTWPEVEYPTR